jgi:hypothetical protein
MFFMPKNPPLFIYPESRFKPLHDAFRRQRSDSKAPILDQEFQMQEFLNLNFQHSNPIKTDRA